LPETNQPANQPPPGSGHVLTQDMNSDLTDEILDLFYRHTLVLFGHYTSRTNYWLAPQIVPKNALEQ
jgi:hypothetical protein